MEVYILDELNRRVSVVDEFESMIWTERFQSPGDFELVIRSNRTTRGLFELGTRLSMNESYYIMIVKSIDDKESSDGERLITVKGESFESLLKERVAKRSASEEVWELTGQPKDVAGDLFATVCLNGALDVNDIIPGVQFGNVLPPGDIPIPTETITLPVKPIELDKAIKVIMDVWNFGFRIIRDDSGTGQLFFSFYTGVNLTQEQSVNKPVVFSSELENLDSIEEFRSEYDAKNVAYVTSPAGFAIVYAPTVPPDTAGLERRVLHVDANDITEGTQEQIENALNQRGREELSRHRMFHGFDGKIGQNAKYRYIRDYNLGDLVEMKNLDGDTKQMRVTEQIFVSDREGERTYPSLEQHLYVNAGSWVSWSEHYVWVDFDSNPISWSELP